MRLLGVDFGSRRIGIALAESDFGISSTRPSLKASGTLERDAEAIAAVARRERADTVVVGIPENPEDERMSRVCRQLAEKIAALGLDVRTVDEALTTALAESDLAAQGLKASAIRRRKDGEAARRILDRFLAESRP
ncbi:MAG: Holliday junction resolvase RuvX [Fimbriimonadaceae bacterium]